MKHESSTTHQDLKQACLAKALGRCDLEVVKVLKAHQPRHLVARLRGSQCKHSATEIRHHRDF